MLPVEQMPQPTGPCMTITAFRMELRIARLRVNWQPWAMLKSRALRLVHPFAWASVQVRTCAHVSPKAMLA
jgi:hypothetical protein